MVLAEQAVLNGRNQRNRRSWKLSRTQSRLQRTEAEGEEAEEEAAPVYLPRQQLCHLEPDHLLDHGPRDRWKGDDLETL